MIQLFQHHFLENKSFHIYEHGLKATRSSFLKSSDEFYPFEVLNTFHIRREFKFDKFYFAVTLLSAFFFIRSVFVIMTDESDFYDAVTFVSGGFLIIFGFLTLLSRKNIVIIPAESMGEIELYARNPTKMDVDSFLKDLEKKYGDYLRQRYAKINRNYPVEEQLWNFDMLVLKNLISDEEYHKLKTELLGEKTVIKGFSKE